MSIFCRAAHSAIQFYQRSAYRRFVAGFSRLESVQKEKLFHTLTYLETYLKNIIPITDYEQFRKTFPVTSYCDYKDLFQSERKAEKRELPQLVRFQPTSGSTDHIKWIPYTQQLLTDFDFALGPWLYDFYKTHPESLRGSHYWSLSWLPQDLRNEGIRLNDTELFPFWKKLLLKQTMAFVEPVDIADSSESSLFATLTLLVAQENLSFVSVWSPSYWTTLLKLLEVHQEEIAQSLIDGRWILHEKELLRIRCPENPARGRALLASSDPTVIWPQLKNLSCWTTSTSATLSKSLAANYPSMNVLGKGLWTTEGVVTIPFQDQYVLAYQSHFFEFEDIQSGQIIPSWELKQGQYVHPILTTSGGLIRYKIHDVLHVNGFMQQIPCLTFLGRSDGVDLVGEKTSHVRAHEILNTLSPNESYLFAVKGKTNQRYCAVIQKNHDLDLNNAADQLENLLCQSFHYRLARELKQLDPAQVFVQEKIQDKYIKLHQNRGMVLGNIKFESLRLITENEMKEILNHAES